MGSLRSVRLEVINMVLTYMRLDQSFQYVIHGLFGRNMGGYQFANGTNNFASGFCGFKTAASRKPSFAMCGPSGASARSETRYSGSAQRALNPELRPSTIRKRSCQFIFREPSP